MGQRALRLTLMAMVLTLAFLMGASSNGSKMRHAGPISPSPRPTGMSPISSSNYPNRFLLDIEFDNKTQKLKFIDLKLFINIYMIII